MKHLLFFTALVATANSLSCQCSGLSTCNNTDVCRVTNGSCFSFRGEGTIERKKAMKITLKGCQDHAALSNICKEGFLFIFSGLDFNLMSNVTCCSDKDQCNKNITTPLPELEDTSSSNLICPTCFALNKISCKPHNMYCSTFQDKCFTIIGKIRRDKSAAKKFIAKGCATESANIYKNDTTLPFGNIYYHLTSVYFEDAKSGASQVSSCLSFTILLPSVLGLNQLWY